MFYGGDLGNRLINESIFSDEIARFLKEEGELIGSFMVSFDTLIEVGCMHGRYLEWALSHNFKYIGIDVVPSYIKEGQRRIKELPVSKRNDFEFILGSANDLDLLFKKKFRGVNTNLALVFFPFNSFGNMDNCLSVIGALKKSQMNFFISTYLTSLEATKARQEYYGACSYIEMKKIFNQKGVSFISSDGLNTIAYHPNYLLSLFEKENINVKTINFSEIGIAYTSIIL